MGNRKETRPDWQPENAGKEFAVRIVKGTQPSKKLNNNLVKPKEFSVDELEKKVIAGDRVALAKAITLIESNSAKHHRTSQKLLTDLLPHAGNSFRIGITGVPGAGKSTLIEALGLYLIKKGHKVAVLTIDPSSNISGGSILGDKTRMENLSKEKNAFIRPSPSGGTLGGVARKTRETITVCEAAGFDIVLIETVGVGQSEVTVRSMVDFFLLTLIAGGGDELQGIKKGIIELTDCIAINKADGDNIEKAKIAQSEYSNALHYLQSATKGWEPKVVTTSALKGDGIEELWNIISSFRKYVTSSGLLTERRKAQDLEWTKNLIKSGLEELFFNNSKVRDEYEKMKSEIAAGNISPTTAAENVLELFKQNMSK